MTKPTTKVFDLGKEQSSFPRSIGTTGIDLSTIGHKMSREKQTSRSEYQEEIRSSIEADL